ncbi:MAG: hypothetical protein O7C75_02775 [Verrucomicrobia bacterium]|nr:hypothetical protein [Verrucomicrobiota bacterium]
MKSILESVQYWFMENATTENISALGMVLVAIFLVVSIYKILKSFHSTMVIFVLALLAGGVFLYWVNNRNEPEFMTPMVKIVADFLPKQDELKEVFGPKD